MKYMLPLLFSLMLFSCQDGTDLVDDITGGDTTKVDTGAVGDLKLRLFVQDTVNGIDLIWGVHDSLEIYVLQQRDGDNWIALDTLTNYHISGTQLKKCLYRPNGRYHFRVGGAPSKEHDTSWSNVAIKEIQHQQVTVDYTQDAAHQYSFWWTPHNRGYTITAISENDTVEKSFYSLDDYDTVSLILKNSEKYAVLVSVGQRIMKSQGGGVSTLVRMDHIFSDTMYITPGKGSHDFNLQLSNSENRISIQIPDILKDTVKTSTITYSYSYDGTNWVDSVDTTMRGFYVTSMQKNIWAKAVVTDTSGLTLKSNIVQYKSDFPRLLLTNNYKASRVIDAYLYGTSKHAHKLYRSTDKSNWTLIAESAENDYLIKLYDTLQTAGTYYYYGTISKNDTTLYSDTLNITTKNFYDLKGFFRVNPGPRGITVSGYQYPFESTPSEKLMLLVKDSATGSVLLDKELSYTFSGDRINFEDTLPNFSQKYTADFSLYLVDTNGFASNNLELRRESLPLYCYAPQVSLYNRANNVTLAVASDSLVKGDTIIIHRTSSYVKSADRNPIDTILITDVSDSFRYEDSSFLNSYANYNYAIEQRGSKVGFSSYQNISHYDPIPTPIIEKLQHHGNLIQGNISPNPRSDYRIEIYRTNGVEETLVATIDTSRKYDFSDTIPSTGEYIYRARMITASGDSGSLSLPITIIQDSVAKVQPPATPVAYAFDQCWVRVSTPDAPYDSIRIEQAKSSEDFSAVTTLICSTQGISYTAKIPPITTEDTVQLRAIGIYKGVESGSSGTVTLIDTTVQGFSSPAAGDTLVYDGIYTATWDPSYFSADSVRISHNKYRSSGTPYESIVLSYKTKNTGSLTFENNVASDSCHIQISSDLDTLRSCTFYTKWE